MPSAVDQSKRNNQMKTPHSLSQAINLSHTRPIISSALQATHIHTGDVYYTHTTTPHTDEMSMYAASQPLTPRMKKNAPNHCAAVM